MDWSKGFSAEYYITIVDAKTWRDTERMEITDGTIERSEDDLMQSADLDMKELPFKGEAWIRVWLNATQDGTVRVPLFTGLTSAPKRDIDGDRISYSVECYSVLKPADDVLIERGYYIPAEVQAPAVIARLLNVCAAPVEYDKTVTQPTLSVSIVAEDGETNLTLAEKVLEAIDWRLRISGDGIITIEESSAEPIKTFDAIENDVIEMSLEDEYDWYDCPNVFRAVSDDLTAIARDDDEESSLSTVSRGREIWAEETSVTLGSDESIASYAKRRLKEEQTPARTVSYTRRFDPDVNVGDRVKIHHPAIDIDSTFKVISQSITLGFGARTSEEATEE